MVARLKSLALCTISLAAIAGVRADEPLIGYFRAMRAEATPVAGSSYYLRYCIRCQRGVFRTTNYGVGQLLPINTRVKLTSMRGERLKLVVQATSERIEVKNIEKYSQKSLSTIARDLLTRKPVPLQKFRPEVLSMILAGQPAIGMTKEEVVMARGFPPGHRTPSIKQDIWVYWTTRMMVATYAFANGILTGGVKLPRLNP